MQDSITIIGEWGKGLPYWEQVTVDKILYNEEFAEEDYDFILDLLLEDHNLTEKKVPKDFPHRLW